VLTDGAILFITNVLESRIKLEQTLATCWTDAFRK